MHCQVCLATQFDHIPYPQEEVSNLLALQEILICKNCGHGVALPVPKEKELDLFYASGGYWHDNNFNEEYTIHGFNHAKYRLSHISKMFDLSQLSLLKVLDVGAGPGHMLKILSEKFKGKIDYFYLEPDQKCISVINSYSSSRVTVNKYESQDNGFDLILINHVIEHVNDPVSFLKNFGNKLSSSGVLYLETPSSDYKFKKNVFPHTLFFTLESFSYLAPLANLALKSKGSFGSNLIYRKDNISVIKYKVFYKLFVYFLKFKFYSLAQSLDDLIYGYRAETSESVWIFGVFSKSVGKSC